MSDHVAQVQLPDLSMRIKATLKNWSIHQVKERAADAPGAVGRCVLHGVGGQTTLIARVDAANRTITTVSGSTYALGTPNQDFANSHPELMKELGF